MPRLSNIARPAEDYVVIHTSAEMNEEAAAMLTCAAYARFERPPARDAKDTMLRAICSLGVLKEAIQVTEHFPEPFLLRFIFPHNCAAVVNRHEFFFNDLKVHVRPWRLEDNADQVTMEQHVRLCIENVPLYAWKESVAQQLVGRACSLDYIEEACKRKDYTKALCVWVWVQDPGLIPRVRWVTLPGPSGAAQRGRRGLQRRCIIHLDILEDMRHDDTPMPGKFEWRWGTVDGERLMRDPAERLLEGGDHHGGGRRDDDDDDRDGRRRDRAHGWRHKVARSLSRAAGSRARDDGRSRQDREQRRERDRSNQGGRRRSVGAPAPALLLSAPGNDTRAMEEAPVLEEVPLVETVLEVHRSGAVTPDDAPVLELHDDAQVMTGLQPLALPGVESLPVAMPELGMPRHMGFGLLEAGGEELLAGPVRRGRGRARSPSPRSSRLRSCAGRTPPTTPDLPSSPTSVIPSLAAAKDAAPASLTITSAGGAQLRLSLSPVASASTGARRALAMVSPASLVGVDDPARPPGFEASPEQRTPVFGDGESPARTPSSPRLGSVSRQATANDAQVLAPLFSSAQVPILPSPPMSSPPTRPCPRRKTMAGTTIARTYGFSLRQAKSKENARRKAAPVAKNAELMLCKGLGIVQDGEVITERAMQEFAKRFQGRIPDDVLGAMRALFKLDDEQDDEVDEALLAHGGAGALDHDLAPASVGEEV
jgi:hypothetical protein